MICVIDGDEEFMLASPILKQNIYNGVFEDLEPHLLPKDMDFFDIDEEKYPLTKAIEHSLLYAHL